MSVEERDLQPAEWSDRGFFSSLSMRWVWLKHASCSGLRILLQALTAWSGSLCLNDDNWPRGPPLIKLEEESPHSPSTDGLIFVVVVAQPVTFFKRSNYFLYEALGRFCSVIRRGLGGGCPDEVSTEGGGNQREEGSEDNVTRSRIGVKTVWVGFNGQSLMRAGDRAVANLCLFTSYRTNMFLSTRRAWKGPTHVGEETQPSSSRFHLFRSSSIKQGNGDVCSPPAFACLLKDSEAASSWHTELWVDLLCISPLFLNEWKRHIVKKKQQPSAGFWGRCFQFFFFCYDRQKQQNHREN